MSRQACSSGFLCNFAKDLYLIIHSNEHKDTTIALGTCVQRFRSSPVCKQYSTIRPMEEGDMTGTSKIEFEKLWNSVELTK